MLGGYDKELPEPKIKNKNGSLYTGKQLFSLFLPSDFNLILTSKWSKGTSGKKKDIVIKNGELVSGVIDKASTMGKIGITCRQPFLGTDEWIEEDLKKANGVEEKEEGKKDKKEEKIEAKKDKKEEKIEVKEK